MLRFLSVKTILDQRFANSLRRKSTEVLLYAFSAALQQGSIKKHPFVLRHLVLTNFQTVITKDFYPFSRWTQHENQTTSCSSRTWRGRQATIRTDVYTPRHCGC